MKRVLSILAVLMLLVPASFADELTDYWLDFGVGSHIPRPVLESGVLEYSSTATNTETRLSCRLSGVTKNDFEQYAEKLKEYGFTTIKEAGFDSFYAYHDSFEYSVYVNYHKGRGDMDINDEFREPTAYDVLKYLFNTYKPEILCEIPSLLTNELIRFGYEPLQAQSE